MIELKQLAGERPRLQTGEVIDSSDDERGIDISGAEPAQIAQLIDTLLNFAQLNELARPLENPELDSLLRLEFSRVLAQRYLAREDFANARKFLPPAEWALRVAAIERLTEEAARSNTPVEKARSLLKLADGWAAARGKLLTVPLDSGETREAVFGSEDANLNRRENARALALEHDADTELENRDELRHAMRWWIKAADAQSHSPITPIALWNAMKVLPLIADVSPYTLTQAAEADATTFSRELYERLRSECPDSVEAKRFAVYWSFPPVPEQWRKTRWEFGRQEFTNMDEAFGLDVNTRGGYGNRNAWMPLLPRILALEQFAGEWTAPVLASEVSDLQTQAHAALSTLSETFLVNFLDDLAQFLQEPDPGSAVRGRYVALRSECMRRSVWGYWPEWAFPPAGSG